MKLSGQTLPAAIFAVAIILFGLWHAVSTRWFSDTPNTLVTEAVMKTDVDSDSDGLKDWEEQLIGSNPQSIDTNSDGISDYEEVLRLRAMLNGMPADVDSSTEIDADQTVTDSITRNLIGAYASAKQLGTYDATAFGDVVTTVSSEPFLSTAPEYTTNDFTLLINADSDTQNAYVTEMRSILTRTDELDEYELTIFARAVANNDDEAYETLIRAQTVYSEMAAALLTVDVPKEAASTHVALTNGFTQFGYALGQMNDSRTDPALAFPAINAFLEGEDMIKAAFSSFSIYVTMLNQRTS